MKNVLHVMNYSASYRGNFIESLENLDSELKKDDAANIYLFCAQAKINDSSVWIEEMKSRGCVAEFLTENTKDNVKLIRRLIEQYSIGLVHTHFITMQQFLDVRSAVPKRIPIVMHMHNHSVQGSFPKEIMRRFIYKRCIFLACSDSVFESIKRDYPGNEKYEIDNGVNFARLDNYSEVTEDEYGVKAGAPKFLIFGFDFFRKGVDLAVKAINDLRKDGNDYYLLISLSTNFESVKEKIKDILGEIPDWVKVIKARNDVATLYNYVDVFLSPSREEGLPYSVIEAGYSKCSVVLSDISAQKNLKLKYGYWFESENVEAFKQQILKAEKEHADKLNNLEEVHNYMRENYALSNWSKRVVELYKKILER